MKDPLEGIDREVVTKLAEGVVSRRFGYGDADKTLGWTLLQLFKAYDEATEANEILENVCEHMATEHIVFGIVGSDEKVHPDWCVQCVFDAMRERLEAHSRQWHDFAHHDGPWSECQQSCFSDREAIERGRNRV